MLPLIAAALYLSPPHLYSLILDDAFYYFKTASNWVRGYGITFDTINPTNGFHPLWFLLTGLIYKAGVTLSLNDTIILKIMFVLISGIIGWTIYLFHALLKRTLGQFPAVLGTAAFVLYPGYLRELYGGLEIVLLVPIFIIILKMLLNLNVEHLVNDRIIKELLLGLMLGLMILTRLDTILIAFGLLITMGVSDLINQQTAHSRIHILISLLRIGMPIILLVLPYLIWNYTNYGHIMPISGSIKSSFPVPEWHTDYFTRWLYIRYLIAIPFIIGIGIAYRFYYRSNPLTSVRQANIGRLILILIPGLILDVGYKLFFVHWSLMGWYFALYPVLVGMSIAFAATIIIEFYGQPKRVGGVPPREGNNTPNKLVTSIQVITLVCLTLLGLKAWLWIDSPHNWSLSVGKAAQWCSENLPEHSRIGIGLPPKKWTWS